MTPPVLVSHRIPTFRLHEPAWLDQEATDAVDAVLLTKALEYLAAHPEEWNQVSWARRTPGCGTTACLAGTAVVLAGHEIDWSSGVERERDGSWSADRTTDGAQIEDLAQRLLGLDDEAAFRLFHYYGDDLATLWRRAAEVSGGRVEVPLEFTP